MYWIRTDQYWHLIFSGIQLFLISFGGWMTAIHAFKLPSRTRIPIGISLGLILFIFFSNIFGRWIAPSWSFWLSILIVLFVGFLAWRINKGSVFRVRDLEGWPQLLVLVTLITLFTLVGRGLAIFDDRKNLSLISLMAAGDIPPHFYMNSDFLFSYHYGFQILGAALMRIGELFPWSAFDFSKGIVGGLAVLLSFHWGRVVSRRVEGGLVFAFIILFMSGTRWLLLLLPPSVVDSLSQGITLWGSGAQSASTLREGLSSIWVIEGGPPTPIPFAFTNGILQPLILYLQAGPRSLALVIFFTLAMVVGRRRNSLSTLVVTLVLAAWALVAEAEFALFAAGVVLLLPLSLMRHPDRSPRIALQDIAIVTFLAGVISLLQGGTITEVARALLSRPEAVAGVGSISADVGFGLRIPPAIVSAHLGEMRIFRPGELVIALAELGPLLLLAPVALWFAWKQIKKGNFFLGAFGVSTLVGFILPLIMVYRVDRDVTRLTQYALAGWMILSWPLIAAYWRFKSPSWRYLMSALGLLTIYGGVVVSGSLLSAMNTAVFADGITPVDAKILASSWDALGPDSLVLDSDPWRAVVLTGRLTRSSASGYSTLPEWEALRTQPSLQRVVTAGFDYIYIDTYWWESMTGEEQNSYAAPCVNLVDEALDNSENGQRWLFDLRACR